MIQTAVHTNDEVIELQNSLRTSRISNDCLSLLLERTRAELDFSNVRVTTLEENVTREANARLFAEGSAVDLNSLLLISDFNLNVVQDQYQEACIRNSELISQAEERGTEIRLLRQDLDNSKAEMLEQTNMLKEKLAQLESKYKEDVAKTKRECDQLLQSHREKIVVSVEDIKQSKVEIQKWQTAYEEEHNRFESLEQSTDTKIENALQEQFERLQSEHLQIVSQKEEDFSQKLSLEVASVKKLSTELKRKELLLKQQTQEILKLQNLQKTTQNQNSLLGQQLSDAEQTIVQKKIEYGLSLEEKMALIRQNDNTISLLQERVAILEGNLTKNIEENEGLQNDKQHLATQISQAQYRISHLVDAKLSLEGKLGQCEKELYLKDEELASLRSNVIVLENNLTERTREIQQCVHQSATKIAELQIQLKKLEAKRIADIADTKQQCQYEYQSLLKERDTAIAKLNESLEENETELEQTRNEMNLLANTKESADSKMNAMVVDFAKLRNQLLSTEQAVSSKDLLCNELKAKLVSLERNYEAAQGDCRKSSLELEMLKSHLAASEVATRSKSRNQVVDSDDERYF